MMEVTTKNTPVILQNVSAYRYELGMHVFTQTDGTVIKFRFDIVATIKEI